MFYGILKSTITYIVWPVLILSLLLTEYPIWFPYALFFCLYVTLPLFDRFKQPQLSGDLASLALLLIWLVIIYLSQYKLISSGTQSELSITQMIPFVFMTGLLGGAIGFTVAHELIHKQSRWLRCLGISILFLYSYPHFLISHLRIHHVWVGTTKDPVTARQGESIYQYIPRCFWGALKASWRLDRKLMLQFYTIWLLLLSSIMFVSGLNGLLFFLTQSLIAIIILEMTQYTQHYGLTREQDSNGKYESVQAKHSWQTNFTSTNVLLFNLGLHANHHQESYIAYHQLEHIEGAHDYPYGFVGLLLLCLYPTKWRKTIDPLLEPAAQSDSMSNVV